MYDKDHVLLGEEKYELMKLQVVQLGVSLRKNTLTVRYEFFISLMTDSLWILRN